MGFTLDFKVAWGSLPLAASPSFSSVGSRILSLNTARGRSFRLDRSQAGTCKAVCLNTDGALDPDYPSGPHYGNIKPGRKAQALITVSGNTHELITLFLQSLPRVFPDQVSDVVTLAGADGFVRFGKPKITTESNYPEELSGARITRALNAVSWPGTSPDAHRAIDAGTSLIPSVGVKGRSAIEHILHCEQSELGRFFISKSGAAVWLARHTLLTESVYTEPQIVFSDPAEDGDVGFVEIEPEYSDDLLYTKIVASRVDGDEQSAEDSDAADEYGPSTLDRGELLLTSDSELEDQLYYTLYRHKRPVTRFRKIRVCSSVSDAVLDQILGLELGYRATVKKTHPRLGYTKTQDVQIEHIAHQIDADEQIVWTTFQLSDADTSTYYRLNHATYGTLGDWPWGF
jgi:hypothetical protein